MTPLHARITSAFLAVYVFICTTLVLFLALTPPAHLRNQAPILRAEAPASSPAPLVTCQAYLVDAQMDYVPLSFIPKAEMELLIGEKGVMGVLEADMHFSVKGCEIKVRMQNPRILIVAELQASSCAVNAVAAHERMHEVIYRRWLSDITNTLSDQALRYGFKRTFEMQAESVALMQQAHDSPAEYSRSQYICNGDLARLMR